MWREHVAGDVRHNVSPAVFDVVDDTVTKVLASRQVFWMPGGLALAVWQISGAVRAVMGALNRIYRVERERSWRRRMGVSISLAIEVGAALLLALAIVSGAPLLYGDVGQPAGAALFVLRWGAAGVLMLLAVGLLLRHGPATRRPFRWVSFGSLLAVGGWLAMSLGFVAYLKWIASYESVFGNLATVVVLMGYLYLSALVFLAGAQVDALVRRRLDGA